VLPVERLRLQWSLLGPRLAGEVVFAQQRAVVRNAVFTVEHDDPAAEASLAQGLGSQRPRPAGADDGEHALVGRRRRGCGLIGGQCDPDPVTLPLDHVVRQIVHRRRL
jgi:hypothetical protein